MAAEFDGDLNGAVFWGAELKGATFRDVDLTGARIGHAWVVDVGIDGLVDRLVVNGVDVTEFVNQRDEWYPLRKVLHVTEPEEMRAGWAALEQAWSSTMEMARSLPDDALHTPVDREFSFAETLRHLVFAFDKWFTVPILGGGFHPFGLPNTGSRDFPFPGLDLTAAPALTEVLAARAEQADVLREFVAAVTADDLVRSVDVLENGPSQIHQCIGTVFEEEFWHNRYARRDLLALAD